MEKATTLPGSGSGSGSAPPGFSSPQGQHKEKQVRSPVAGATTGNVTSVGASLGGGFLPGITLSKPTTTTATTTTTTGTTTTGSTTSPSPGMGNGNGNGNTGTGGPTTPSKSQSQTRGPLSKKPTGKKASSSSHPDDPSHAHPEKEKELQRDPTRQGKGKDLSHVPCRFFKMGACAAGEGCVFSHNLSGAGEGGESELEIPEEMVVGVVGMVVVGRSGQGWRWWWPLEFKILKSGWLIFVVSRFF